MPLIQCKQVTKRFRGLVAVSKVSLNIEEGEILSLIGPNGAGKTTLFNTICGFHPSDEGTVHFKGKEIQGSKPEAICKEGIARTFQIVKPFGNLTVLENVIVGAFNRQKRMEDARETAVRMLEFVGLRERMKDRMKDLTFPQQKKVELARALATKPALLFLDEVMSGLNPAEVEEFVGLIQSIREQGITVFFIEHLMSAVMSLSDRVIVMNQGEKIAEGKPQHIARDPVVVEAYLGGAV